MLRVGRKYTLFRATNLLVNDKKQLAFLNSSLSFTPYFANLSGKGSCDNIFHFHGLHICHLFTLIHNVSYLQGSSFWIAILHTVPFTGEGISFAPFAIRLSSFFA